MTEVDDIPPPDFTRAPVLSLDVFAHPQRWLFAGECPPPLRDPRPWVRGIRATLLLGLMGWCVGGLGWLAM